MTCPKCNGKLKLKVLGYYAINRSRKTCRYHWCEQCKMLTGVARDTRLKLSQSDCVLYAKYGRRRVANLKQYWSLDFASALRSWDSSPLRESK